MNKEKAEKIIKIYNWIRIAIIVALLTWLYVASARASVVGNDTTSAVQTESSQTTMTDETGKRNKVACLRRTVIL